MTLRPCPKPPPREKAPRTKLPAVSERHDDPTFWSRRRKEVLDAQGGRCVFAWDPGERCRNEATDCMHVEPLGTRATRNADHPLNAASNLLGGCRVCHRRFDAQTKPWRRAKAQELRDAMIAPSGHGAHRTGGIR